MLDAQIRAELFPFLGAILRNQGCTPLEIGGVEDHVHLLFGLSRTMSLAQVVESLKTGSNRLLKTKAKAGFAWQGGYGAFSVNARDVDHAAMYIRSQERHHRKVSFQDELRALMAEAGIDVDERYLWE